MRLLEAKAVVLCLSHQGQTQHAYIAYRIANWWREIIYYSTDGDENRI